MVQIQMRLPEKIFIFLAPKVSEYDLEIAQSHTADQTMAQ